MFPAASGLAPAMLIPENIQAFGADVRQRTDHQVGEIAPRAASHGPAQGAMAGVEIKIFEVRATYYRCAVRRRWPQTRPEFALFRIAAARIQPGDDFFQRRTSSRRL